MCYMVTNQYALWHSGTRIAYKHTILICVHKVTAHEYGISLLYPGPCTAGESNGAQTIGQGAQGNTA